MDDLNTATGEQLANALYTLGVHFVRGVKDEKELFAKKPVDLISALAASDEARLQLSLIPLFLLHPDFSEVVNIAAGNLIGSVQLTLKCYYTAAVFLQKKYQAKLRELLELQPTLPDIFSSDLGFQIVGDPEENLRQLASRHQELSGMQINWLGTYEHAVLKWLPQLELQKR